MTVLDPAAWSLARYPATQDRSLRAFDAADQLALASLAERIGAAARVLVVNDGFGGLAIPLVGVGAAVTIWSDSVLAAEAIARNLRAHAAPAATVVPSNEVPVGPFEIVLIKVPKTLALLDEQLALLRPGLDESTVVVGAGMVKHIHSSTLDIFETRLGPTVTSLAKKKARLIHPTVDVSTHDTTAPPPTRYETDEGIVCVNRANVFSQRKLDIGTRVMLAHLPAVADGSHVLDLGCGNGALGATSAARFSGGAITFCDISHAAVASATATWAANHPLDDRATFLATDLAAGVPDSSIDLVLLNPPFHDQHVIGDETARRMFTEAKRVLRVGGELRVVGNRHLGYHKRMRSMFGNLETVGSNPKFVVLSSRKASPPGPGR